LSLGDIKKLDLLIRIIFHVEQLKQPIPIYHELEFHSRDEVSKEYYGQLILVATPEERIHMRYIQNIIIEGVMLLISVIKITHLTRRICGRT